jgi:lysophospholipase L1-like esterase
MRVLIVGDSQAAGPAGRRVEERRTAAGHLVQRIGHVGHGAYDWTRMHWDQYQAALRSLRPTHVIMIFGGNDPANERLAQAFRQFKDSAPHVVYAGPPRYDARPDLQERSRQIRDLAKREFGAKHLDAWPYSGPSVPRARDQVHFSAAGGNHWGDGIVQDWSRSLSALGASVPSWLPKAAIAGLSLAFVGGAWWWSRA